MKVLSESHLNFTSRNRTIRLADDIVRKVNNEFPRVSPSNLDDRECLRGNLHSVKSLSYKLSILRRQRKLRFFNSYGFQNILKSVVDPIKTMKVGNCGESADLSYLAARANGLKNSYRADLVSPAGDCYDHAVVIVDEKGKNPYVIDAWLGFADYLPKAIERYQKDFRQHFDFEKFKTDKIEIVRSEYKYQKVRDFYDREFTVEEVEMIRKMYPQMLLDNKR